MSLLDPLLSLYKGKCGTSCPVNNKHDYHPDIKYLSVSHNITLLFPSCTCTDRKSDAVLYLGPTFFWGIIFLLPLLHLIYPSHFPKPHTFEQPDYHWNSANIN